MVPQGSDLIIFTIQLIIISNSFLILYSIFKIAEKHADFFKTTIKKIRESRSIMAASCIICGIIFSLLGFYFSYLLSTESEYVTVQNEEGKWEETLVRTNPYDRVIATAIVGFLSLPQIFVGINYFLTQKKRNKI